MTTQTETRLDRALANLADLNAAWEETSSSPKEMFNRLRFALLKELEDAEKRMAGVRAQAKEAEEKADEIKTLAVFEADGRNAEERKANLIKVLQEHGLYQEARTMALGAQGRLVDAEAIYHRLQREWTALTLQCQLRIAVLNFLASDQ